MSNEHWVRRLAASIEAESLAMAEILRRMGVHLLGDAEPERWIDRSGNKITIYFATPRWLHVLEGPKDQAVLGPETTPNDEFQTTCTYSADPITARSEFRLDLAGRGLIQSSAANQHAIRKVVPRWTITIGTEPLAFNGLDAEQDAFAKVLVGYILARSEAN